ncbi:MAG: hypothetical protein DWQ10_10905 [Calditrichaeota bacterium]|nr:MAG: hypothetical protein DWQ10_10905 [Calditrichota bacterium]
MALRFSFTEMHDKPVLPDPLLHQANILAEQAQDAKSSRETLEQELRAEVNHPLHQKVRADLHSRRLFVYGGFALIFLLNVIFEWMISNEIYAIVLPQVSWLAIVFCIAIGIYASLCFGETTSYFSFISLNKQATNTGDTQSLSKTVSALYDRKKQHAKHSGWYFHPILGCIIAAVLLAGIYSASQARVGLLQVAGEVEEGFSHTLHLFLPVILYALEILFGMPALYFLIAMRNLTHVRTQTKELTLFRDAELVLKSSVLEKYTAYVAGLNTFNTWAQEQGEPAIPMLPVNQALRNLLNDELNYNSVNSNVDVEHNAENSDPIDNPNATMETHQMSTDDSRVNDLIDVLDSQIDAHNSGL